MKQFDIQIKRMGSDSKKQTLLQNKLPANLARNLSMLVLTARFRACKKLGFVAITNQTTH